MTTPTSPPTTSSGSKLRHSQSHRSPPSAPLHNTLPRFSSNSRMRISGTTPAGASSNGSATPQPSEYTDGRIMAPSGNDGPFRYYEGSDPAQNTAAAAANAANAAAAEDTDEDDIPLGAGLAGLLPRRNHTISSGTARSKTKRLAQHFEQPAHLPAEAAISPSSSSSAAARAGEDNAGVLTADGSHGSAQRPPAFTPSHHALSPSRNSLKEITGLDDEHDEWEKALLDERTSAADDLAAMRDQDSYPLASTASAVRRHQSLNNHLGRSLAGRVSTAGRGNAFTTTGHNHPRTLGSASSSNSLGAQLQNAFHPSNTGDSSPSSFLSSSPVKPTSFSSLGSRGDGTTSSSSSSAAAAAAAATTSPSRYAHTFGPSGSPLHARGPSLPNGSPRSSSPTLQRSLDLRGHRDAADVQAALTGLDLGSGSETPSRSGSFRARMREVSAISDTSTASASSSQNQRNRLPSLVTDADALAARHQRQHSHHVSNELDNANYGGVGVSASPNLRSYHDGGHSRIQSIDALPGIASKFGPGANQQHPSIADVFGPRSAAPGWTQRDTNGQSGVPPQLFSPQQEGHSTGTPSRSRITSGAHNNGQYQDGNGGQDPTSPPPVPSQWGLGLSPTSERDRDRDQITMALTLALQEQQQKTAMLEAALRASQQNNHNNNPGGTQGLPQYGQAGPDMYSQYHPSQHQHQHQHQQQGQHQGMMMMMSPPTQLPFQHLQGQQHQGGAYHLVPQHHHLGQQPGMYPHGAIRLPGIPLPPQPHQQPHSLSRRPNGNNTVGNTANAVNVAALNAQFGMNASSIDLDPPASTRFLVIKSFTEEDVHRSIRHGIWASTDKGNQRLDRVYKECQAAASLEASDTAASDGGGKDSGKVYLFFSINSSGHFCSICEMLTPVDFTTSSDVWAQEGKWKGHFKVRHLLVKDVPNREFRHLKLDPPPAPPASSAQGTPQPPPGQGESKNVTQSRDTQELAPSVAREILKIIVAYQSKTTLLADVDGTKSQVQTQAQTQTPGQTPGNVEASPRLETGSPDVGSKLQQQQGTKSRDVPVATGGAAAAATPAGGGGGGGGTPSHLRRPNFSFPPRPS